MIIYGSDNPGAVIYIQYFLTKSRFERKKIKKIKNLEKLKKNINFLITGSAIGKTLDKEIVAWGKRKKIPTISIIEDWKNFKKRFIIKKKIYYPDFIFVVDDYAKKLAIKEGLPSKKILISGNDYLKNLIKKKNKYNFKINNKRNILFISEPLSEDNPNKPLAEFGYDEFKTLDLILKNRLKGYKLTVKLHPRETIKKYFRYKDQVKFIRIKNLKKILKNYDIIIGMNSMLLLELGLYRNDIISFRPNSNNNFYGGKFGLTKNIEKEKQLRNLLRIKPKNDNRKFIKSIISTNINADNLLKSIK